ncbi:MAG: cyanophycinase [Candidatus Poribacteria bacterium]|nr:cyanophycinase [Candidatus Poribacteria bacterium]
MNGLTLLVYCLIAHQQPSQVGPENGSLLLVGGGVTPEIGRQFIALAGGVEVPMVVIPTAGGATEYSQQTPVSQLLRQLGAKQVEVVHTNDRELASSLDFVQPLVTAKGVFFEGGRQWRLVDAYQGTRTEQMFWQVLERGGVIGGSSAGATIQGSFLARGDTRHNQIMVGDHQQGFGFLKNVTVDQHTLARNRHYDMFQILQERPELLGLSIDEMTGIVVAGDQFEVIGESYVLVYDGGFWSREGWSMKKLPPSNSLFYFLKAGDRYDMAKRIVVDR